MAYNNPFSFASDDELQPFWNSSDLFGDINYSYGLTLDAQALLKSSQSPAVAVDNCSPPLDITPPYSVSSISAIQGRSPQDLSSSMITQFNIPNMAYFVKRESTPFPPPSKRDSSSSSYSVELDEALSMAPEDDLDIDIDPPSPFIVPSPPAALPGHFYPPSSSPCFGDQNQTHYKRFREEYETDLSIDGCGQTDMVSSSMEDDDPTGGFKLPASKSPIMEAMVVCALNGWGIDIVKNNRPTSTTPAEVVFRVTDFNRYYKISRTICSKQRPTDDLGSRIKSLRRWFVNFPKKKDRCENSFFLIVKPTIAKKVNEIIERNSRSMGLVKRRRKQ